MRRFLPTEYDKNIWRYFLSWETSGGPEVIYHCEGFTTNTLQKKTFVQEEVDVTCCKVSNANQIIR